MTATQVRKKLNSLADRERARLLQGFFKTGPGEYGEGDRFLGVPMPVQRKVVREVRDLPVNEVLRLLKTDIHEYRMVALLLLVEHYRRGDRRKRERVCDLYLKHARWINNWDLVDVTAPHVVGAWLVEQGGRRGALPPLLRSLAHSRDLWERRIAVVSMFAFIREGRLRESLVLARMLLADKEDLIHKATGWMLREVGKRDRVLLEQFLDKHVSRMPRTMLRYAIERFPERKRQSYLKR